MGEGREEDEDGGEDEDGEEDEEGEAVATAATAAAALSFLMSGEAGCEKISFCDMPIAQALQIH